MMKCVAQAGGVFRKTPSVIVRTTVVTGRTSSTVVRRHLIPGILPDMAIHSTVIFHHVDFVCFNKFCGV